MRISTSIAVAVCLTAAAVSSAHADTIVLTAKGVKQGEIKGSLTQRGREGGMQCTQWSAEVTSPRDTASGTASGKRQYKPVLCVKKVDNASPALLRALVENESL